MLSKKALLQRYPLVTGAHNPLLKKPVMPITQFDDELLQLHKAMHELVVLYDGIGLAGPQINVHKSIVVVGDIDEDDTISYTTLINPTITDRSAETFHHSEGCLSLPGIECDVVRHMKISYSYQDVYGNKHSATSYDFHAAVVQHEIDHLHGILITDPERALGTIG